MKSNTVMLDDIVNPELMRKMVDEGYINVNRHPHLPIFIYNYSDMATYKKEWNAATLNSRGLIVDDAGRIVARGPRKFFNYGEPSATKYPLHSLVNVTRKEDGSLGILWHYEDHFGIATRGSFMSDQAQHATALITSGTMYDVLWAEQFGDTMICEIVYPENRIVLDYKGRDELISLGLVRNESGIIRTRELLVAREITLAQAIAMPIPDDEEGYVLDVIGNSMSGHTIDHLKLKGQTYMALHGILTNTSARRLWVQLAGRELKEYIEDPKDWARLLKHDPADFERIDFTKEFLEGAIDGIPDEFYDWVTDKMLEIKDAVRREYAETRELADKHRHLDGRELFEAIKHHPARHAVTQYIRSGRDAPLLFNAWIKAKPKGLDLPFRTEKE